MSDERSLEIARQLTKRRTRADEILSGQLPTTAERLAGYPPLNGSEAEDRTAFFTNLVAVAVASRKEVALLQKAKNAQDPDALWELINSLPPLTGVRDRALLSLALEFGDEEAQAIVGAVARSKAKQHATSVVDAIYGSSFAEVLDLKPRGTDRSCVLEKIEQVIRDRAGFAQALLDVKAALGGTEGGPLGALARLARERDSAVRAGDADQLVGRKVVVVPAFGEPKGSAGQKDIFAQFKYISGVSLPVVGREDLGPVRAKLIELFPHFLTEIDLILRQKRPYRLLLIGNPGCGKTSLARVLADALGLSSTIYPAGGSSDGSFGGTSAQWSTTRASLPLQCVLRSRNANPLIVVDEIDKCGSGRNNGAFVDTALTFFDSNSASRVLDPALELEVDLSAVSYVATANSLDGVPAQLRDRLRVIRMPDPKPEHAPSLIATALEEIAAEWRIDRRWFQPLARDELEIILRAWPGGSLRRLRRVVELILDVREQHMERA